MEVRANSEPFKQIVIWLFDSIKGHQINSSQTIPASLKFLSSNVKEGKVCFGQHMITVKTYHRTMFILKKRSASVKYFCSHMSEVLLTTSIYAHFYHYLVLNEPSSILQWYQSYQTRVNSYQQWTISGVITFKGSLANWIPSFLGIPRNS